MKEKLIDLMRAAEESCPTDQPLFDAIAETMIEAGVIVPCKMGDYVRFKGLRSLWKVISIHVYEEGQPQITVISGKIVHTTTVSQLLDDAEIVPKEQAIAEWKGAARNDRPQHLPLP